MRRTGRTSGQQKGVIGMSEKRKARMVTVGRARAGGFTLIEVLVVVAIIALLVSILIPALTRAKDQARRAVCAAHLHQILISLHTYASDHKDAGPMRGWFTYSVSESRHEGFGWPGQGKVLVNLGQLYKKWIASEKDLLYCPSTYSTIRDNPNSGWPSLWKLPPDWTYGSYNYAIPVARRNDPDPRKGPGLSPNFRSSNIFPRQVWGGGMINWVQTRWLPDAQAKFPGTRLQDFRVPTAPALVFDWFVGNSPPHMLGTGINVLYSDGHIKFQRIKSAMTSGDWRQYQYWYDLSIRQ